MTDPRVAYLGPAGTFTEAAARLITGASDADLAPCSDVNEVLRAVADGRAARGVVPIENALEGSVTATLDALAFETDLLIQGELEIPVTLVVAGRAGVRLEDVTEVHSHPVALGASSVWLSKMLPDARRVVTSSTARAAEDLAERADATTQVAIVNPLAAERYGLDVLARDVADRAGNSTRFVVVGTSLAGPTGRDKTSLVVFIESNRPGALLKLLEIFAERDLNLTKIESRPTKAEMGDYCFFLDVEGHLADERVGDALAAVKRTQRDVKLLGSYHRHRPTHGHDGDADAADADEAALIRADDEAYRAASAWVSSWREQIGQAGR